MRRELEHQAELHDGDPGRVRLAKEIAVATPSALAGRSWSFARARPERAPSRTSGSSGSGYL